MIVNGKFWRLVGVNFWGTMAVLFHSRLRSINCQAIFRLNFLDATSFLCINALTSNGLVLGFCK